MSEPMSAERLAELRQAIAAGGPYANPVVAELLAELDRLRVAVEHLTSVIADQDAEIQRQIAEFDQSTLGARNNGLVQDLQIIVRYLEDGAVEDALRMARSALDGEAGS